MDSLEQSKELGRTAKIEQGRKLLSQILSTEAAQKDPHATKAEDFPDDLVLQFMDIYDLYNELSTPIEEWWYGKYNINALLNTIGGQDVGEVIRMEKAGTQIRAALASYVKDRSVHEVGENQIMTKAEAIDAKTYNAIAALNNRLSPLIGFLQLELKKIKRGRK